MSADEADFSRREFQSPDNPDREWLDWFREGYGRKLYHLEIEPNPDVPFRLEATTRLLPDLAIAISKRSPMRTAHRGDQNDDMSMVVMLDGQSAVKVRGVTYELMPGMGGMGYHGVGASIEVPDGVKMLSIRLRRKIMEPMLKGFSDFAALRDTEALRLLLGYVRMLEGQETIASSDSQNLVTAHVHDLAALAFGLTRDAENMVSKRGVRAARLAAIKEDILRMLLSPELSVTTVAARQGVSPRYVHMLFELEGVTFSEFVVGQRLVRAHRMLSDLRYAGHTISAIALMVGFGDLSYFNRTFRRRFGMSPSDVRATGRERG